jgi:hypothetical protein
MLLKTQFTVPKEIINIALNNLPNINGKFTLNRPLGDFFYDSWEIKENFKNTVWETILNSLPFSFGEARIIILNSKTAYVAHSDIDDRYHLNIQGENSFLLDVDNCIMHKTECDGIWYEMNAGKLHSAVNLSGMERIQLVVRKLLNRNNLIDPQHIKVIALKSLDENNRYIFDQITSKWLNQANKEGKINNFKYINENEVTLNIEKDSLQEFKNNVPSIFEVIES